MATYAVQINERTNAGRSLYQYLDSLGVIREPLTRRHSTHKHNSLRPTQEELIARLEESRRQIANGQVYSHEEAMSFREKKDIPEELKADLREAYRQAQAGEVVSNEEAERMMDEFEKRHGVAL